jgi:ParB-like chromosome segregation protein Spo0J
LKLLARAEAYQAIMTQKRLTKAQLARKKKTSRARITQIMNLLKLDSETIIRTARADRGNDTKFDC